MKGSEDRYLVSKNGEVYSLYTHKKMKFESTKDGYLNLKLTVSFKNHIRKMVHRLVAETWLEQPPQDGQEYEIDHIDNNRQNNKAENLRWVTHKENLDKSFNLGNQTKLKRPVTQYTLDGKKIATYGSVNEAFRQTNIRHISEAARQTRKSAGGYIWRYK